MPCSERPGSATSARSSRGRPTPARGGLAPSLRDAYARVREAGFELVNADCILIGEEPRIAPPPRGDEAPARGRPGVEPARVNARDDYRPPRLHRHRRGSCCAGCRAPRARAREALLPRRATRTAQRRAELGDTLARVHVPRCRREQALNRQYEDYPDLQLWLVDDDDRDDRGVERRRDPVRPRLSLPDAGWDAALEGAFAGDRASRLGDRDHDRSRPGAVARPQQGDARRVQRVVAARGLGISSRRSVRASASLSVGPDRALHRVAPRGRQAARSMAADHTRMRREADPRRHPESMRISGSGRVGGLDEARLPRDRHLRRPGRARPGRDRPRTGRGRLRSSPNVWMHHTV